MDCFHFEGRVDLHMPALSLVEAQCSPNIARRGVGNGNWTIGDLNVDGYLCCGGSQLHPAHSTTLGFLTGFPLSPSGK